MTYGPIEFVADQLRAAAPNAEWNAAGVDRARELSLIFNRAGIRDLSRLGLVRLTISERIPQTRETENGTIVSLPLDVTRTGLALEYDGRRFGFLGTPDRADSTRELDGTMVAWSAAGHGNVGYHIIPAASGFAFAPYWGSSSDAGDIREAVKFFAIAAVSFALPAMGVAVGQSLGAAIVGAEFAAAYPAMTAAIGNVALSTAMNGGNIENAVRSVALNYAGAGIGDAVGGAVTAASDAEALGRIASAATTAFVRGGNVDQAVAFAVLREGATMEISFDDPVDYGPTGDPYNVGYDFNTDDVFGDVTFGSPAPVRDVDLTMPYRAPTSYGFTGDLSPVPNIAQTGGFTMPTLFDVPHIGSPIADGVVTTPPPSMASGASAMDIINTVSSAALASLKVAVAWDQIKNPVRTAARTTTATGAVRSVGSDGLIRTTNARGGVSTAKPPANQPMSTVDGNIINNNGDGTYTIVAPNGATSTRRYPDGAAGGMSFDFSSVQTPLLLGGVGLLALLLIKRKG